MLSVPSLILPRVSFPLFPTLPNSPEEKWDSFRPATFSAHWVMGLHWLALLVAKNIMMSSFAMVKATGKRPLAACGGAEERERKGKWESSVLSTQS